MPAACFELDGVAWIQPSQWLARILTGRFSLDFKNRISDFEARTLSLGASRHGLYFHGSVEIPRSGEAGVCGRGCTLYQAQSHTAEDIIPGNLFRSSDVLREEIFQIGVTHSFGSFPHAVRVGKEPSLLRIVLIHPLEDFAQRSASLAHFPHLEVEHHTEQFSFVVIRNAALRTPVVGVAFEP